jgi:hypothetical protein
VDEGGLADGIEEVIGVLVGEGSVADVVAKGGNEGDFGVGGVGAFGAVEFGNGEILLLGLFPLKDKDAGLRGKVERVGDPPKCDCWENGFVCGALEEGPANFVRKAAVFCFFLSASIQPTLIDVLACRSFFPLQRIMRVCPFLVRKLLTRLQSSCQQSTRKCQQQALTQPLTQQIPDTIYYVH